MNQLPWYDSRDFSFEISLNRRVFVIRARHNHLTERYSLDFFTADLVGLMFGQPLVSGVDLLDHFPTAFHPGGYLFSGGAEPTYENLVSGASMVIYDAAV